MKRLKKLKKMLKPLELGAEELLPHNLSKSNWTKVAKMIDKSMASLLEVMQIHHSEGKTTFTPKPGKEDREIKVPEELKQVVLRLSFPEKSKFTPEDMNLLSEESLAQGWNYYSQAFMREANCRRFPGAKIERPTVENILIKEPESYEISELMARLEKAS